MSAPAAVSRLDRIASAFIAPFGHYAEIPGEQLAEFVRAELDLPAYPDQRDLIRLCTELGIEVGKLPLRIPGVRGTNHRFEDRPAAILLAPDLTTVLIETTIPHELREVLENAFRRAKPSYVGLDTHNNALMNPISDRFAGYLLMETSASRALMTELGFDLMAFARQTGRSIASVMLRAQQLYSADSDAGGPVMGAWLFEADWESVRAGTATLSQMAAKQVIALSGFSQEKGTIEGRIFPRRRTLASAYAITRDAFARGRIELRNVSGFDLLRERDYLVAAEPVMRFRTPWRVLVTAVRKDHVPLVLPWIARVGVPVEDHGFEGI